MQLIPAGISKNTGKSYQAFWSCKNRCPKFGFAPKPQGGAITSPQVDKTAEVLAKLDAIKADLQTIKDSQIGLMQFIQKELGE